MIYHLYLIGAMIIVGSSVPAGKLVVDNLPVYYSMAVRFLIGTLFMFTFVKYKGFSVGGLGVRAHLLIAVQAMLGSVFFTLLLLEGLKTLSASASGIITGTLPVVVLVLSVVLTGERLNLARVVAVFIAALGVMFINADSGDFSATLKGSLFVLAAVVCEAGFLLLRKKLPDSISSLVLSLYVSMYGFIYFILFAIREQVIYYSIGSVGFGGYLLIAYYGMFITAVAYILWFKGIARVSGSYASVYTAVMPVSAVVLSSVLLGERLTIMHLGGLGLVLLAMVLIRR